MTATPTVIVIGGGPAAIAAARRLSQETALRVQLVVPDGAAEYLPGTLAVATGDAPASRYRTPVVLEHVEVVPARAEALASGGVRVEGSWLGAQAIIAAPGLVLDPLESGSPGAVVGFWDPTGAQVAAPRIEAVEHGVVQIVIGGLPYRCPPAPYGLAMRIARRARRLGRPLEVRLSTPEEHPLAALGRSAGDALLDACASAGVEVQLGARLDPDALAGAKVVGETGSLEGADLTIVIPPHRASPLLNDLSDGSVLVPVDDQFATAAPGIFVAGDAAASGYPRAADPAAVSGVVAAEAALAELGYADTGLPRTPEPDCFVDYGEGRYGRIRISYPGGPPPVGKAAVAIDGPMLERGRDFDDAHRRWQALRGDARVQ